MWSIYWITYSGFTSLPSCSDLEINLLVSTLFCSMTVAHSAELKNVLIKKNLCLIGQPSYFKMYMYFSFFLSYYIPYKILLDKKEKKTHTQRRRCKLTLKLKTFVSDILINVIENLPTLNLKYINEFIYPC